MNYIHAYFVMQRNKIRNKKQIIFYEFLFNICKLKYIAYHCQKMQSPKNYATSILLNSIGVRRILSFDFCKGKQFPYVARNTYVDLCTTNVD